MSKKANPPDEGDALVVATGYLKAHYSAEFDAGHLSPGDVGAGEDVDPGDARIVGCGE